MDRDEMICPDWKPLERFLLGNFMFMGCHQGIRMYKHYVTRHYLHLDTQGRPYRWIEKGDRYERIKAYDAILAAIEGLDFLYNPEDEAI